MRPVLCIVSCEAAFDPVTLSHWRDEGFAVTCIPYDGNVKVLETQLMHIANSLEASQKYGLIGYGVAGTACLEICSNVMPGLAVLVAYYPDAVPTSMTGLPGHVELVVHLAASQAFAPPFKYHVYPDTNPGYAERNHENFDRISSSLSWTRSLGSVRTALNVRVDLEAVWEDHVRLEFMTKDAAATMTTMVAEPYVNHIPTLTGGIDYKELLRFYRDFFIPNNPPSLRLKLISRTVGVDRVVDEMLISFKHTQVIDWMLPSVPATNKEVLIALVGVICIRGGKLYHEHLYWDQASVLVQIGLLDPKLVPESMRRHGLDRLPVYGAESALKVMDESSWPSNELIAGWD